MKKFRINNLETGCGIKDEITGINLNEVYSKCLEEIKDLENWYAFPVYRGDIRDIIQTKKEYKNYMKLNVYYNSNTYNFHFMFNDKVDEIQSILPIFDLKFTCKTLQQCISYFEKKIKEYLQEHDSIKQNLQLIIK